MEADDDCRARIAQPLHSVLRQLLNRLELDIYQLKTGFGRLQQNLQRRSVRSLELAAIVLAAARRNKRTCTVLAQELLQHGHRCGRLRQVVQPELNESGVAKGGGRLLHHLFGGLAGNRNTNLPDSGTKEMRGDLSARFHAGNRGILPPNFLICNIALNLALKLGRKLGMAEFAPRAKHSNCEQILEDVYFHPAPEFGRPDCSGVANSFIPRGGNVNLHATRRRLVRLIV